MAYFGHGYWKSKSAFSAEKERFAGGSQQQVDGWMNRQTERQTKGQMDIQANEQTDRQRVSHF